MHSTKENLQVLFEDNHIIIVNKRSGDITQGDKTGDKPLSDVVKEYIKKKIRQSWQCFFRCCSSIRQTYFWSHYFCKNLKSFRAIEQNVAR